MASNTTGEKAPSVKASSVKAESVEAPSEKVPSKKVPSVKAPSIEAASVRSSLIKDDPFKTASIESVDTESLDEDVMDSGRRAWMTMIGGFLTGAVTFGYANSFGVYQDLYTRSNTASASAISWIGSTQLFFLFAMGLPAGKLLDMGHFRVTTAVGSLIYVFSLFMISICNTDKYYQLYLAQGLGMGIGGGLLYVPCIAVQSHHWRARRALAMGVVATGASVGGIIFPIMLNQLFKGSLGFAWGVRVSGFIVLTMLLAANLFMSAKPSVNAKGRPKPDLKVIMTDAPYLITILAVFVTNWGVFFPYFYLQLYAFLHGVNQTTAFYLISVLNASGIPGRIIPNLIADRIGPFNVAVPCILISNALIYALFGIKSVASIIVFAILYGFFSGAIFSITAPAFAELSRDPSEVGIRFGIAFFLSALGALIGTPVTGALLGHHFNWNRAITFSGVSFSAGVLFLVVARQILSKRKNSQRV